MIYAYNTNMKVLIVEDEAAIGESLKEGLDSDYAVDWSKTGEDAIAQTRTVKYDVILLDLNLPDVSGENVCRTLREYGISTPIIVISGQGEVQTKIKLLDVGADDFIPKPFNLKEVKARIRAVLRRGQQNHDGNYAILSIGDLQLNPASRTVMRAGELIKLRRKEFDILEYLMRSQGRAVTRAMIFENVWDTKENLWANVVDVHIKHLRDKIERPFGDEKLIQTVHGVGYKLEAAKAGYI